MSLVSRRSSIAFRDAVRCRDATPSSDAKRHKPSLAGATPSAAQAAWLRKRFRMFGADASLRCAVPVSLSHSSQGRSDA
jgi:hypothetical protein